jgi:hypothetical protein
MFQSREQMRQIFFSVWEKHIAKTHLDLLENQILQIIFLHPEYHVLLSQADNYLHAEFGQENPFLHMSLHFALREQIATNRPLGITEVYKNLLLRLPDNHVAEHLMLDSLQDILFAGQTAGKMLDENDYLARLKKI